MKLLITIAYDGTEITFCADKILAISPKIFKKIDALGLQSSHRCTHVTMQSSCEEGCVVFTVNEAFEIILGKLTKL